MGRDGFGMDPRERIIELIRTSRIHYREEELEKLLLVDYGLGNLEKEGVGLTDIVYTPALRLKILAMLPNQTLPEHKHPPYGEWRGKEETIRVVYGTMRVYLPGEENMTEGFLPERKEEYYTVRNESILTPIDQLTIEPDTWHWFQAGPKGAVAYAFYPQAVERKNYFRDPGVPEKIAPGY